MVVSRREVANTLSKLKNLVSRVRWKSVEPIVVINCSAAIPYWQKKRETGIVVDVSESCLAKTSRAVLAWAGDSNTLSHGNGEATSTHTVGAHTRAIVIYR